MSHRRSGAASSAHAVLPCRAEGLERRTLFALVTFTLDPDLSSLRLSGEVASVIDLEPQNTGSLLAAYDGSIIADVEAGVVTFPGGSNVVARATRHYSPGDGPANYGGEAETGGLFNVKIGAAAIRDLKFDVRSDALAVGTGGGFDAGGVDLRTTGGELQYDLNVGGDGDIALDDLTLSNKAAGNATLRGEGANLTLTIPIDIDLDEGSADLRLQGTLVANVGDGAPVDPNTVRIGNGTPLTKVQFEEADGTRATIELRGGGSADIRFENATTQAEGKGGTVIVRGEGVRLLGIDAAGTARSTKLALAGKGGPDKVMVVPSLTADGQLGSLGGKGVSFSGPVTIGGRVSSFSASTLASATVTADSIGTTKITGDVTASTITLDAPFVVGSLSAGRFTVGGAFSQSKLIAAGPIGPVKATTLIRSSIFSAVTDASVRFPQGVELLPEGAIGTVTSKNYVDTILAADTLGKLKLGKFLTDNGGVTFGLAADVLGGLRATNEQRQTLNLRTFDDPAALEAALAEQRATLGDFTIFLS